MLIRTPERSSAALKCSIYLPGQAFSPAEEVPCASEEAADTAEPGIYPPEKCSRTTEQPTDTGEEAIYTPEEATCGVEEGSDTAEKAAPQREKSAPAVEERAHTAEEGADAALLRVPVRLRKGWRSRQTACRPATDVILTSYPPLPVERW